MALRGIISEQEAVGIPSESTDRLDAHRRILQRKKMIREVFSEFHHVMMDIDRRTFGTTPGLRIELGAGVFPIREDYPDVMATDIIPDTHLDRVLDAQSMDLPTSSVRTLFGQNCFHHFPDPEKFFAEASRVISPGGGIVLIEPYYGPAATLLYKRLFTSEGFDKHAPRWNELALDLDAKPNQALSYLVLKRDVKTFNEKFPELEIIQSVPLRNYVRYVSSGGLNFRQLVPDALVPILKAAELVLSPFASLLALHYVITLRRR